MMKKIFFIQREHDCPVAEVMQMGRGSMTHNHAWEEAERIRRDLHQLAETAYEEVETGKYIASFLSGIGVEVVCPVAKTGVVGLIRGGQPGPTVAFRADMDALPIEEETGVKWSSANPGTMHACGHDVHMAAVLGAAMLLAKCAESLRGNVKLIFQPAEEAPGGAEPMVAEGVMDDPKVDCVFAFHVTPDLPVGKVGVRTGHATASHDRFAVTLKGRRGHSSAPHKTVDAVVAACEFVCGLQTIVSRRADPLDPIVLGVGRLSAGSAYNVVADKAVIEGSARTVSDHGRKLVKSVIEDRVAAIEKATGVEARLDYAYGYPSVVNDPDAVDLARTAVSRVLGPDGFVDLSTPSLIGEDFAFFTKEAPGVLMWLGAAPAEGQVYPLHHQSFLAHEESVPIAAMIYHAIAVECLAQAAGQDE